MREATRRQILADIGIAVWYRRAVTSPHGLRAEPAPVRGPEPAEAEQAVAAPVAQPVPPAPRTRPETDRESRPSIRGRSVAAEPAPHAREPQGLIETPWSVLSLALGGVVMLVDGDSSRRDLRLAQDVLSAAAGEWRSRPVSRRFDWPPPVSGDGAAPAQDAGARALAAFAGKDLEDHEGVLLICEAGVEPRLGEVRAGCRRIAMPRLDVLGRDSDAKRQLWHRIRDARS